MNWFSSGIDVVPLDMDRDVAGIDRLMEAEQWPFVRSDLEVSHAQPRSVAVVGRRDDEVLGFFLAHNFGDIGYLDMVIVDERARRTNVGQRMYSAVTRGLAEQDVTTLVAHSTNDSYRVFKYLRFTPGQSFTLLARDPVGPGAEAPAVLGSEHRDRIVRLDGLVFGMERPTWIDALLSQPGVTFLGRHEGDDLAAMLCLRERKAGALCIDAASAASFADLRPLVEQVLAAHGDRRLECFARTDGELHALLGENGFASPEFFVPIGPLVEWMRGGPIAAGQSPLMQSLSWF